MEQLNPQSDYGTPEPDVPEIELGPEKAWVALAIAAVGSGLTTALGFISADSPWFAPVVIAGAVLTPVGTAFGVYAKRASLHAKG